MWSQIDNLGTRLTSLIKLLQGPMTFPQWLEAQRQALEAKNELNNLKSTVIARMKGGETAT